MRKHLGVIAMAAVLFMVFAGAASAHHASATVTCDKATVNYVSTQGTRFWGTLFLDTTGSWAPAKTWSITAGELGAPVSGTLEVPYSAPVGTFGAYLKWYFSTGESGGLNRVEMSCSPTPVVSVPSVPATPVANTVIDTVATTPAAVSVPRVVAEPKPWHKPRKVCRYGRKHLRDSHGRRFSVCRKHPGRGIVGHPQFTG